MSVVGIYTKLSVGALRFYVRIYLHISPLNKNVPHVMFPNIVQVSY